MRQLLTTLLLRGREQVLFGVGALVSPRFLLALLLGPGAWLLPEPSLGPALSVLSLSGLVEEIVFRLLLQGELHRLLRGGFLLPGVSRANISASAVFAALHLVHHPPLWALSVFFPSLIFGWAMDRYNSVLPPVLLHICYNLFYFYRL